MTTPDVTSTKELLDAHNNTDDIEKLVCANCSTLLDNAEIEIVWQLEIDSKKTNTDGQTQNLPQSSTIMNDKDKTLIRIQTAVSIIYKLDCLNNSYEDDTQQEQSMALCGQCASILLPLFKLYDEFNDLRKFDSLLGQKIHNLDTQLETIKHQHSMKLKLEADMEGMQTDEGEDMKQRFESINSDSMGQWEQNEEDSEFSQEPKNLVEIEMNQDENTSESAYDEQHSVDSSASDDTLTQIQKPRAPKLTKKSHSIVQNQMRTVTSKTDNSTTTDSINPFQCNICQTVLTTSSDLVHHLFMDHAPGSSTCPLCLMVLAHRKYLKEHLCTHVGHKPHMCPNPKCDSSFRKLWELKKHCQRHHPDSKFVFTDNLNTKNSDKLSSTSQLDSDDPEEVEMTIRHCGKCSKKFMSLENLKAHRQKICRSRKLYEGSKRLLKMKYGKIEPSFKCPLCPQLFLNKFQLSTHLWKKHVDNGQTSDCPLCLKKYPSDPLKLKAHILYTHAAAGAGSHECPTCHKKFYRACNLARHIKCHQKATVDLTCELCGKSFQDRHNLNIHLRRHAGDLRYPCPVPDCGKAFVVSRELKMHEKTAHLNERPFKCVHCDKAFVSNYLLKSHTTTSHTERPFTCPSCSRRFVSEVDLKKHVESICKGKKKFVCQICGKTYAANKDLIAHLRYHANDPILCPRPDCDKKFYIKSALETHLKLHDEGKKFKCPAPNCDKSFSQSCNFNSHFQAMHPDLIEDQASIAQLCPVCGVTILGSARLKKHVQSHNEERPHKCHLCPKAFKKPAPLKHHLKIHAGDKTFHCEFEGCYKSFYRAPELKKHFRLHTGEKSFQCKECGKFFRDSGNLKKHSLIHFEPKFNCHICDRVFKQPQSLKTHLTTHK